MNCRSKVGASTIRLTSTVIKIRGSVKGHDRSPMVRSKSKVRAVSEVLVRKLTQEATAKVGSSKVAVAMVTV